MLSRAAYDVANYVVYGCSLHDLRSSMIYAEAINRGKVDEYIRLGLRDLVESGWLEWTYEPDYGTQPSTTPDILDLAHFDIDWGCCVTGGELREVTPSKDNPTLFLQARDSLVKELRKAEYSRYGG